MGKYKSVNTGDYKAMSSVETKQKESNMVTTMETKQSEYAGVITTAEMEMSDYKRCKVIRAETKATMPKKLITSLGFFPITSVEINEGSSIQFCINLDSSVIDYECRYTIGNCIESQDKAKRIGWTWNNAKIELSMRLHVIIDSKEITFSSKDKASLTLKTDSIERIDKISERDTCYSIRMKVYNINFIVIRR